MENNERTKENELSLSIFHSHPNINRADHQLYNSGHSITNTPLPPELHSCDAWWHGMIISLEKWLFNRFISSVWMFPLACSLIIPSTNIFVFVIAVEMKQIEPFLPYVSDAGTLLPQAGVFSMLLDTIAILISVTVYLRYRQLMFFIDEMASSERIIQRRRLLWHVVNLLSTLICYAGAFGLLIAGNFRMNESIGIHLVGASIFFVCIYVYAFLEICISWNLTQHSMESKPNTQLIIILFGTVSLLCCFLSSILSMILGEFFNNNSRLHWNIKMPGYQPHVIATTSEWITINCFALFVMCTCLKMKRFNKWTNVLGKL